MSKLKLEEFIGDFKFSEKNNHYLRFYLQSL